MKYSEITNHQDLLERIYQLRMEKLDREIGLKSTVQDTIASFDQMKLIKGYIREIAADNEIKSNLVKIGINLGINYLLKKLFNPKMEEPQEQGLLMEYKQSLIQHVAPKVASGIQKLLQFERR